MTKKKLKILYESKEIIVVEKEAHLLTVATDKIKDRTLYHQVHEYLYQKNKNNRVFIVHRLDKDTSGIVLFAKSQKIKELLQNNWNELAKKREYYCIVENHMESMKGTIRQYLKDTSTLLTVPTNEKDGKLAITNYEVINNSKKYAILKVQIETGRKNQIRVAMQSINHPIVGDIKYGAKTNPLRRLCLHATMLEIIHPLTHEKMTFTSQIPDSFKIF